MERPLETPLTDLHRELGARLVPFAGYAMPVQFGLGIRQEHAQTRARAALFDVSHMGQFRIAGDATAALERIVPSDIAALGVDRQRYTVLTNDGGGIADDLLVTRRADGFFVVVNAATKAADRTVLEAACGERFPLEVLDDRALLALQGPAAAAALQSLCPEPVALPFLGAADLSVAGIPCLVHRCGYTGEDGFELSVAATAAVTLAQALLECDAVEPAGLGARDLLRLEAGLCLAGADIDATTSPIEAALEFTIARKYRTGASVARFPGADIILRQLEHGAPRRRVGLTVDGPVPVRPPASLRVDDGTEVGTVTSGGFSPSLDRPIAMGYVQPDHAREGTRLIASVRKKEIFLTVTRLPFVPHRYHRG